MSKWTPGPWVVSPQGASFEGAVAITASGNPLKTYGRSNRAKIHRAMLAEAPAMTDELEKAAVVFEHYAELHRAKGTPDGDAKAEANAQHAQRIRALLARVKGEG